MGFIIDNPDRELMFLIQAKHRLKLEIQIPGLRFNTSRTTMSLVNQYYGTDFKRKVTCLAFVEQTLEEYERLRSEVH